MENNISDKIDQYLDGKMSAEEKIAFEKEISSNETLRQQVETQSNLRQGIERLNLKSSISSQFKKMSLKSKLYKWGIATVAITAIATASYFGYNSLNGNSADNYTLPALNEEGKPEWSSADKNLPTQLFSIGPNKDTVLETEGGIVFAVSAGAFLDAKEPLTLEVREALTPMDIMKAELSTMSDGKLLETGGMFYLNARNGEQSLKINPEKPVYANVPTNEIKPDMMLFSGERKADGSINWKNPKKLEKQLIPVDINKLDFYPKGFREKCAELGFNANNKRVTDSIYYSYAGRRNESAGSIFLVTENDEVIFKSTTKKTSVDSVRVRHILISYKGAERVGPEVSRTEPFAYEIALNLLNDIQSGKVKMENIVEKYTDDPGSKNGNNGDYGWFTQNSGFVQEFKDAGFNNPKGATDIIKTSFGYHIIQVLDKSSQSTKYIYELEINPSRISAIWNDKFQNTIIATKEFEERLQIIFKYGREDILGLYINNLNKKMYEIDSMVVHIIKDVSAIPEFTNFYLRHDGGIAITENHMKKLQDYFAMKKDAVQMAAEKTFGARKEKEQKDDKTYSDAKTKQLNDDEDRKSENFNKEFDINLTEAYRQLGYKRDKNPPVNKGVYYGFAITNVGWCNVDRYVYESTLNRTTLDYTDPNSGKKAVIKYETLTISIDKENEFEQVQVYLVPDSLNSFMKVNKKGTSFKENLNELFKYSLVVVGQKGKKWYWSQQTNVKPGNSSVQLNEIAESQLRTNLNTSFTKKAGADFRTELDMMIEEHEYKIQTKLRQKQEEIDAAIMPVIFPFYVPYAAPLPKKPDIIPRK